MSPAAEVPRIVGRYALYGVLASGGMATVHYGRLLGAVGFSKTVAIKRLHAQFARNAEFVAMFSDEARLAARIQHPNVVSTLDVVSLEGELFLVMEHVAGESLANLLAAAANERMRLPPPVAAAILVGVLDGLHAAHEAKDESGRPLALVHRDVSPQNVLVGVDGVARVLDFGVAKAIGRLQTTPDGKVKGKLSYMAPEQISGKVSRVSDVYSASVVLWEALTGRRLFDGDSEGEVFQNVLEGHVDPPSAFATNIPPELDALTLRGLSRDPAARFATAREMARALERSVPLATAATVGELVERLGGRELARRQEDLLLVEQASRALETPGNAQLGRGDPAKADPELVVPDLDLAPRSRPSGSIKAVVKSVSARPSAKPASPPSGRPRATPPAPPAYATGALDDLHEAPAARIEIDAVPPAMPAPARVASRDAYRSRREPTILIRSAKPRRSLLRYALGFLVLIVFGVCGAVYEAPNVVKDKVAQAGRRSGLMIAVDQVVFRPHDLTLTGSKATVQGLPEVGLTFGDVTVALEGIEPRDVHVRGFDLSLKGEALLLYPKLEKWAATLPAPFAFDADAGHVKWTDPWGPGTELEAWDVTVSTKGKLAMSAASAVLKTPRARIGPWKVKLGETGSTFHLELGLDPSAPAPAYVYEVAGDRRWTKLDVPLTPLSRLGIPAEALGLAGDPYLEAHASTEGGDGSKLVVALTGIRAAGAPSNAPSTDAQLGGTLAAGEGDASALGDGAASWGAAKGKAKGSLTLRGWPRADLALKWSAPGSKGALPSALTLDSREVFGLAR